MFCRYFLIFFIASYSINLKAQNLNWNCTQDKDGQWDCLPPPQDNSKTLEEIEQAPVSEEIKPENQTSIETKSKSVPLEVKEPIQSSQSDSKPIAEEPKIAPTESLPLQASEMINTDDTPLIIPPIEARKPIIKAEQDPGWSCKVNEEHQTWNCDLKGTDPKGQAKIMDEGVGFSLLDPAFDSHQEQIFSALATELRYDPWQTCTLMLGSPPPAASEKDLRDEAPLDVGADYSEIFDNEIVSFTGNVHLTRADQKISSDRATYDTVSQTLDLQGNVLYSDESLALFSDNAQVELATDQARLRDAQFIYPITPIRGDAKVAYRETSYLNHFKEASYTSCAPGNQDWVIHASRFKMNKRSGLGSVKHAWLEFKGLPVFYLPYLGFPLDDRRQSGLLTPSFGTTERSGVDISIPYYWNIAPNFDATIWARYLSKRSGMLGGQFRYLTEMTRGRVEVEILPYDTKREETRWSGSLQNYTVFTPRLRSDLNVNYVSDEDYFDDLGNSLSFSNYRHLYSYGDIVYNRPGVHFSTKADNYQVIDLTIPDNQKPYRRLPQTLLNFNHSFEFMPLDVSLNNEFVYFQHDDIVNGQRLDVKPTISIPFKEPGYYINPKITGQFTQYWLQNRSTPGPNDISRFVPIASLDTGMFFERDFKFGDSGLLHTIEPRLFYLYIPRVNQDDIPLFDTSEYDFTFSQLFRENRFNGPDRIADANQLTMAITTRLLDTETGQQLVDLSIGNIFYFEDREVQLSAGTQTQTDQFSNLVAQLNAQITTDLRFQSGIQWNPERNDIDRGNVSLRYRNEFNHIFNAGYRYRVDNQGETLTINQTDVSFLLPIYNNWNIVGRWQYSILHGLTVESFIGLEKESCCWRFRILGRRFVNNVESVDQGEGEAETAFYFQFVLKGLTSVGTDVETFLENNLFGYRSPFK